MKRVCLVVWLVVALVKCAWAAPGDVELNGGSGAGAEGAAPARPEELLVQRVRETLMRQQEIRVPHALEHEDFEEPVTVTRLEPDGVHVRHAAGLTKIPFERLTVEQRRRYEIDAEGGRFYRAVRAQRESAAAAVAAASMASAEEQQRSEHAERLAEIERNRELWLAFNAADRLFRAGRRDWVCPMHPNGIYRGGYWRKCERPCQPTGQRPPDVPAPSSRTPGARR